MQWLPTTQRREGWTIRPFGWQDRLHVCLQFILPKSEAFFLIVPMAVRNVIIGRHSVVWRRLQALLADRGAGSVAISHRELADFPFAAGDRVWLMSYSRDAAENSAMLAVLQRSAAGEVIYLSSSSAIVASRTGCYGYPRVKHQAEQEALRLPNARVLVVGAMHDELSELPTGPSMATSYAQLAEFFVDPRWPGDASRTRTLFTRIERPFDSAVARWSHRLYGRLLMACGPLPCLLRPLDALLRLLGARWYGYTYLSTHLWTMTTS